MNVSENLLPLPALLKVSVLTFLKTLALIFLIYVLPCVLVMSFCSSDLQGTYDAYAKNKPAAFAYKDFSRAAQSLFEQSKAFVQSIGPYDASFSWGQTLENTVEETQNIAQVNTAPYEILLWQLAPKIFFYVLIFAFIANAALVFVLMDVQGRTGFVNRNFFELFGQFPMLAVKLFCAVISYFAIILAALLIPLAVYVIFDIKGIWAALFFGVWTFIVLSILFFIFTAVLYRPASVFKNKWPRGAFYYSAKIALAYPYKYISFLIVMAIIIFALNAGKVLFLVFLSSAGLKFSLVFMTGALITGFIWLYLQTSLAVYFLNIEAKINPVNNSPDYYRSAPASGGPSKNSLRGNKMETLNVREYEMVELPSKITAETKDNESAQKNITGKENYAPQNTQKAASPRPPKVVDHRPPEHKP